MHRIGRIDENEIEFCQSTSLLLVAIVIMAGKLAPHTKKLQLHDNKPRMI